MNNPNPCKFLIAGLLIFSALSPNVAGGTAFGSTGPEDPEPHESSISAFQPIYKKGSQNLLPKPVKQDYGEGYFMLDGSVFIHRGEGVEPEQAHYLLEKISRFGEPVDPEYIDLEKGARIELILSYDENENAESYHLNVRPNKVEIIGSDRAGLFYGIQTFLQLLPPEVYKQADEADNYGPVAIPAQSITDHPRYSYRGMMLDIARTFSDKERVMKYIDHMATHKLNVFHWHLTDDEGWRIEIKSYPRLAQVGGFRGGDSPVKHIYGAWNQKYGGYFTQEEIREVVEYAALRSIQVIPEIEFPGHSRAAARVYPEILCAGTVDTTAAGYDMRKVWCVAREENYTMIENILREVCDLFPSPVIHIGGDEVPPEQWLACPHCQALMKEQGYETPEQLNGHFMSRVSNILESYGKTIAVWNEATEGGNLPADAFVYGWEKVDKIKKVLAEGFKTVIMPAQYFYFDQKQSQQEPGLTWAGIVDDRKTYSFEPDAVGFNRSEQQNILGLEGAFFSELYVSQDPAYLDYQVYPRLCALAEKAWSEKGQSTYQDYEKRMNEAHFSRLSAMGIKYRNGERRLPEAGFTINVPTGVKYTLKSNIPASSDRPFANACDGNGRTYAKTTRTAVEGDWFLFEFMRPVRCRSILIRTGFSFLGRYNISGGRVLVSYDGMNFEPAIDSFEARGEFAPLHPVKAIKIEVSGNGNGEDAVYIQDLMFK